MKRRAPRPLATALAALARELEPPSALARVQAVWQAAVGEVVAAHCVPAGERGGILQVVCDEAVWSAELQLLAPQLLERLGAELGREEIVSMRVRTSPSGTLDSRD